MPSDTQNADSVADLIRQRRHLVVLTGAGCSTESGIPDYRDADGQWKHRQPVQYRDFVDNPAMRRRYWARSMIGWQRMATAEPNRAHVALARLQQAGHLRRLITQNVDGLHQRAGSQRVIDLHGRLANVICLDCGANQSRESVQVELLRLNPDWQTLDGADAPDGDAQVEADFDSFRIADCPACGGLLKPDVVFFGESVPAGRVAESRREIAAADCLLVVGSSLMLWSGLRFVRAASQRGIPTALINLGRTRADEMFTHRVTGLCGDVLSHIAGRLGAATA